MAGVEAKLGVNVAVGAEVEFRVGEKTAAWLVSIGWTPPVDAEPDGAVVESVETKVLRPSAGLREAKVALNSREQARADAKAKYYEIVATDAGDTELVPLLEYFGVNMEKFLAPTRSVEIPGLAEGGNATT